MVPSPLGLSSFHSPIYFDPSINICVAFFGYPFLNWPSTLLPSGLIIVPLPSGRPSLNSPVNFVPLENIRVPFKNFSYNKDGSIFILGDSVAFGNGIKEEETFIGLFRKQNKNVNFINSSVPGRQIFDQIKIIEKAKTFKKVDKILYIFTLSDVYGSSNVINLTEEKKDESDYGLKKFT